MTSAVLALDVGGTSMKAAVADTSGTVLIHRDVPTDRRRGPDAVVGTMIETLVDLRRRAAEIGAEPVAVGVAVPGRIDEDAGVGIYAANLQWRNTPIRERVAASLQLPTVLRHDIRSGAVAEQRLGAGRGHDSFVFVAIGTGIAASIVLGGQVWRGERSVAGELGHVVVRPHGPRCACGQTGCLEAVASAAAIARTYSERSGHPVAGARDVLLRAQQGDALAASVWVDALSALADGIVTFSALLDVGTYVIGGGLAAAGDHLFGPLRQILRAERTDRVQPHLVPAELGPDAGCLGAALAAIELAAEHASGSSGAVPHQAAPHPAAEPRSLS